MATWTTISGTLKEAAGLNFGLVPFRFHFSFLLHLPQLIPSSFLQLLFSFLLYMHFCATSFPFHSHSCHDSLPSTSRSRSLPCLASSQGLVENQLEIPHFSNSESPALAPLIPMAFPCLVQVLGVSPFSICTFHFHYYYSLIFIFLRRSCSFKIYFILLSNLSKSLPSTFTL